MIDHTCFWTGMVLAAMYACSSCQTPPPKPVVAECPGLVGELKKLNQRLDILEGELAVIHSTPDDRVCPREDRD